MKQNLDNEKQTISYLLGEMSEAERDRFEEQIFLDEDLSVSLDAAENDLVDEYLRGELDAPEKQKFDRNFLISEHRREKLRVAEILQKEVFAEKSAPVAAAVPFWQRFKENFAVSRLVWAGGLAAIVLLILLGGFWLIRQKEDNQIVKIGNENQNTSIDLPKQTPLVNQNSPNSNLPQNIGQEESANTNEKPQSDSTLPQNSNQKPINTEEKPKSTPSAPAPKPVPSEVLKNPRIFAFTLLPPIRSGEKPVLVVPPETQTIRLRVVHNNQQEFIKYLAEIRSSDGVLIWSREIPVTKQTLGTPLTLNVGSGMTASGSYELTLRGATADGQLQAINYYNFTVRKK